MISIFSSGFSFSSLICFEIERGRKGEQLSWPELVGRKWHFYYYFFNFKGCGQASRDADMQAEELFIDQAVNESHIRKK